MRHIHTARSGHTDAHKAGASSPVPSDADLLTDLEQFQFGDHLRDDDESEAEQQVNGMTFDEVMAAYDLAVLLATEGEVA